jgi:hypothetical protein
LRQSNRAGVTTFVMLIPLLPAGLRGIAIAMWT